MLEFLLVVAAFAAVGYLVYRKNKKGAAKLAEEVKADAEKFKDHFQND